MRARVIVFLTIVMCAPAAVAQQKLPPIPPTLRELLVACDSKDAVVRKFQCDRPIMAAFVSELDVAGSPGNNDSDEMLCLPSQTDMEAAMASYEASIIAWLRVHPQIGSAETTHGLISASKAIYLRKKKDCPGLP